jgi:hypothetical protein
MSDDEIVSLKNSIILYEKALARETGFIKKLRQPENIIHDSELNGAILGPSVTRLFDIYDNLLNSYRQYVIQFEKRSKNNQKTDNKT